MKKLIIFLITFSFCLSLNAQVIRVYEDGRLRTTYTNGTHKYKVVFENKNEAPIIPVSDIVLSKTNSYMVVGDVMTIDAIIYPPSATYKSIMWTSSNPLVASVSVTGEVTAQNVGTTTITATSTDGSNISASCLVTVVSAMSENLLRGKFSVSDTKQVQFTRGNLYWDGHDYHIEPSQDNFYSVWDPSHVNHFFWTNSADADVDDRYPYLPKYAYGPRNVKDEFFAMGITVDGTENLTTLSANEWKYLLGTNPTRNGLYRYDVYVDNIPHCIAIAPDGYEGTLQPTYFTSNPDARDLVFLMPLGKRSNTSITLTNKISDVMYWTSTPASSAAGSATYIYHPNTTVQGATIERSTGLPIRLVKTVEGPILVSSIRLSSTYAKTDVGKTFALSASVSPDNAANKDIIWTSDNESVAIVDTNGKVTTISEGAAFITATAADGSGVTAICKVDVISGISKKYSDIELRSQTPEGMYPPGLEPMSSYTINVTVEKGQVMYFDWDANLWRYYGEDWDWVRGYCSCSITCGNIKYGNVFYQKDSANGYDKTGSFSYIFPEAGTYDITFSVQDGDVRFTNISI